MVIVLTFVVPPLIGAGALFVIEALNIDCQFLLAWDVPQSCAVLQAMTLSFVLSWIPLFPCALIGGWLLSRGRGAWPALAAIGGLAGGVTAHLLLDHADLYKNGMTVIVAICLAGVIYGLTFGLSARLLRHRDAPPPELTES